MTRYSEKHPFRRAIRLAVQQARRDNARSALANVAARKLEAANDNEEARPSPVRRLSKAEIAEYERELLAKRGQR